MALVLLNNTRNEKKPSLQSFLPGSGDLKCLEQPWSVVFLLSRPLSHSSFSLGLNDYDGDDDVNCEVK